MKLSVLIGILIAIATLYGCGDGEAKATEQDKAVLDRVSKEGLGPPKDNNDPYQNTNKQGGLPGNPPPPGS